MNKVKVILMVVGMLVVIAGAVVAADRYSPRAGKAVTTGAAAK